MNRHTKRTGLLLAGLMAGSLLVGCSAGTPANTTSAATSAVTTAAPATTQPGTQTTELELTLEELAKYITERTASLPMWQWMASSTT